MQGNSYDKKGPKVLSAVLTATIIVSKKRRLLRYIAKTKVLISCLVTVQLICAFVFCICKYSKK